MKPIVLEDSSQIQKPKLSFASYHQALKFAKKINTDPAFTKANLLKELEAALAIYEN